MMHPLDRPVWSALSGRQSAFALTHGAARRFAPDYGVFAAIDDASPASREALAVLLRSHGDLAVFEIEPPPPVAGATVGVQVPCWQMVAERLSPGPPGDFAVIPLTEADAPEMLALATLTRPGPFNARTHELGDFLGVRKEGRLVAMAGERMKVDGFTEISGVCTHPDCRGRGYAAALMRALSARIGARGEGLFLHVRADNAGAISLYEALGFRKRRELLVTELVRD